MTSYFVAPFEPKDDSDYWKQAFESASLRLNPIHYRTQLLDRWPNVEFHTPIGSELLIWTILDVKKNNTLIRGIGYIQSNAAIVGFDSPYSDYFMWHRSVIPDEHGLWLFSDSGWRSLELISSTTLEEIELFLRQ